MAKIVKVDLKSSLFCYDVDPVALQKARLMDGKLLLVTNTTDLSSAGVVARYKSLADIERGFRVLKTEIEIGPIYHRLPKRIKAHAMICFIALILHRVMRMRLRAAGSDYSPERALEQLERIQHHKAHLNNNPVEGLSTISSEQLSLLAMLEVKKPTTTHDLSTM